MAGYNSFGEMPKVIIWNHLFIIIIFFSQMQMDFHIIIIHIFFIFKTSAPLVGVVFSALQVVFFYSPEMMQ